MKQIEMEGYANRYSQALFRNFDKVYRLDYDTGYAEVLHTSEEKMKIGDKVYFRDFFERFDREIISERKEEYRQWMKDKEAVDEALRGSRSRSLTIDYRVDGPKTGCKQVWAVLIKVTTAYEEEGYLLCLKRA